MRRELSLGPPGGSQTLPAPGHQSHPWDTKATPAQHLHAQYAVTPHGSQVGAPLWRMPPTPSSSLLDRTSILVVSGIRNITLSGDGPSCPSLNLVLIFYRQPQEKSRCSASKRVHALSAYRLFILCMSR